jgi:hypothetical protein
MCEQIRSCASSLTVVSERDGIEHSGETSALSGTGRTLLAQKGSISAQHR